MVSPNILPTVDNKSNLTASNNFRINSPLSVANIKSDDKNDFFPITTFNKSPSKWNAILPYSLLIVKANIDKNNNVKSYETVKNNLGKLMAYVLPISPQNLSINMPFAMRTTVLADGILVEGNGIPIRQIVINGTTGILPFRDTNQASYNATDIGSIFTTVQAGRNLVASFKNFSSNVDKIDKTDQFLENTGYEHFHKLSEFLQYYAFLAKQPENKDLRLAIDLAKDNITYLVTPKTFTLTRVIESPNEYRYNITLEAWKRIKLEGNQNQNFQDSLIINPFQNKNLMQNILDTLNNVSKSIASASDVITAVRGDINRILGVVKSCLIISKESLGLVNSLLDLPSSIIKDAVSSIIAPLNDTVQEFKTAENKIENYKRNYDTLFRSINDEFSKLDETNMTSETANLQTNAGNVEIKAGGLSNSNTPAPSGGATEIKNTGPGSITAYALANPDKFPDFFNEMTLDKLSLPENILLRIQQEKDRVSLLTRQDFENYRNYINEVSRDMATYFGLGSPVYDKTLGSVGVAYPKTKKQPGRFELDILFSFRKLAQVLDHFCAQDTYQQDTIVDSFNFIGKLATTANIDFNVSPGKTAVPVVYGITIDQLAFQYLGDEKRALEIIALNGLEPPFIDEDGTFQLINNNGLNNSITVSNADNLYINQKIILSSSKIPQFSRKITDIKPLSLTSFLITVDGKSDLGKLKIADNAQIQYFKPNTVSSRDLIYIPSEIAPSDIPQRLKPIPRFTPDDDKLIEISKIDLALSTDNDIILDKSGNVALSAGMANLIQALKLKIITPIGSLIKHPSYGFAVPVGINTSAITVDLIKERLFDSIVSDSRFTSANNLNVSIFGPAAIINGSVNVKGLDGILPFSINIS